MIIECGNCGAPLDVTPASSYARCAYCGRRQRVRSARTQMQQTPVGWRPPQQWTPPAHVRARSVPMRYHVRQSYRVATILTITMQIIGVGIVVFMLLFNVFDIHDCSSSPPRSPSRSRPRRAARAKPARPAAACLAAARCCRLVAPEQATSCDSIAKISDESICSSSLNSFRRAADSQGKSCQ